MKNQYKGISINTTKNTHEEVFNLIKSNTNRSVIDVPAGSGAFVQRLIDNGFKKVKAMDIEQIAEIEDSEFVYGDMTKTFPFEDNSHDVLVCIDGIEHITRQSDFISETHRVLKMGGEVVISTPNISSIRSRWRWFWTGHHHKCSSPLDENNPTPLHHVGMISFAELRYLLHVNGFRVNKVSTNRIKFISYLYALFVPFVYLSTKWIYIKTGKREGTSRINKEIIKTVFSSAILFGETLIVKAEKVKA